eukprot:2877076-Prymnesium_polylepis.1
MKKLLLRFCPNAPLVKQYATDNVVVDSAIRGGTLAAAPGIVETNARLREDPGEQAAQLGGSGISVEDANAPPVPRVGSPPRDPQIETAIARNSKAATLMSLAPSAERDALAIESFQVELAERRA